MIKSKKVCSIDNCDFPVYGKSLCFYHYRSELSKKKSLKKTPMRKISEKQIVKNKEKVEKTRLLHQFFLSLWKEVSHKCQSCDKYLGEEPLSIYFDHLLEKSKYPEFMFEKNNIFICCADCHHKKSLGFPTQKHEQAIKLIKERHGIN